MSDNSLQQQLEAQGLGPGLHKFLADGGLGELVGKMGIKFLELGAERTVATMPVLGNTQHTGILHGGAHLVLGETLGSLASALHAGEHKGVLGIEISATHHKGVSEGLVTGTCTALHLGRTLASHEIVMRDSDKQRLSTVRMTNILLEK